MGDFATQPGIDCDIDIVSVTVLSYLDIIVASFCNFLIVRYLVVRFLERSHTCCGPFTQAKQILPYFFLLHGLGDVCFCLLKVCTVGYTDIPLVGKDISITLVSLICPTSIFAGLTLYYVVVINFLKGYACMMTPASRDKVYSRYLHLLMASYSIPVLVFFVSVAPFVGLKDYSLRKVTAQTYLIGLGLISAFYGVLYALAIRFLLQEITIHIANSSINSDDITQVLNRLRAAYYAGSMLFLAVFVSYLICGSWNFILRKSSYVFLVIQIASHPFVTTLILTVSRISNPNKNLQNINVRHNNMVAIHPGEDTDRRMKVSHYYYFHLFLFFKCHFSPSFNVFFFLVFILFLILDF